MDKYFPYSFLGNYTNDHHLIELVGQACTVPLDYDWQGRKPLILPLGYDNLCVLSPQYSGPALVLVIWGYSNKMSEFD